MRKEKIVLKSTHPEEYPDLEIECKVIENDEIADYLATIPAERKCVAYKTGEVEARLGQVGEEIKTTLKTTYEGKEYILSEENAIVGKHPVDSYQGSVPMTDMVVTNTSSTSNEQYVVKYGKFIDTYCIRRSEYDTADRLVHICTPKYDPRELAQVDENIIIMTAWGQPAVCLAGSYIVTYDAKDNDYNTLEAGAFKSTYTTEETPKQLKK